LAPRGMAGDTADSPYNHPGANLAMAYGKSQVHQTVTCLHKESYYMIRPSKIRNRLLMALIGLCAAGLLCAQEFRSTLTGTITDPAGAAVSHAQVEAINQETKQRYAATTSDSGVYFIPYVLPGTYTVKVSVTGFKAI